MDQPSEIRDFLTSRRARITPEQADVPTFAGARRVPGLRREEVAHAAGISVDYYNRLERGKVSGVSVEVLDALARTLQLNETERDHLLDLFETERRRPRRMIKQRSHPKVRPGVQRVLDGLDMPAFVENARLDIVAANRLGRALYSLPEQDLRPPFNVAQFLFLDQRARGFYVDWDSMARNQVALLRTETGRDPSNPELISLVGQLSTQSEEFRKLWAANDVRKYREGPKRFRHPIVGELEFIGESFEVSWQPGLVMVTYTTEPASPTEQAVALLASWTATPDMRSAPATSSDIKAHRSTAGWEQ